MSWLDKLEGEARKSKPPTAKPEVRFVLIQTREPNEATGDPGRVQPGHYVIDDGRVYLTTHNGTHLEDYSSPVQPGLDPQITAAVLLREHWLAKQDDFNTRTVNPRIGRRV